MTKAIYIIFFIILAIIISIGIFALKQNKLTEQPSCFSDGNSCCKKNESCNISNVTCEIGSKPQFKGCDVDCEPIVECVKTAKDETVDWRVYANERFKYSVKYPNDFIVQAPQNTAVREIINISKAGEGWFTIDVSWGWKYENVNTIEDLIERISNPNKIIEPYILDGISGFKVTTDNSFGGKTISVMVEKNNYLYDISCVTHAQVEMPLALNIFNQILSTFRFLE